MSKKILLVDDEPELVFLIQDQLQSSGYEVSTAEDGQTGLEKARSEKPDLILLDLMLPKLDGHKICGLLKKDTRYADIPIIMLTAKAREEDVALAHELGADAYFTKPFQVEILIGKIQQLLGN